MTKKSFFSVILSVIMAFSAVTAFELAFTQSSIVAYAAGISAPSVSASNASYKSIKLTWKKVKGAEKYTVMRSTKKSSGYKAIKTVTKNTYTDTKVTCSKTYYYKVTAVKGSTKKTSKTVKIKCTPAKVSGVKATSTDCSKVKITFKKVSGASGYDVKYSSTKGGKYKSVATAKTTKYTHTIGMGSTGYYKVRAYRTVKGKKIYGPYSSIVSATAISHSYGSYTVDKSPTCGEAGTKYTVCSICGNVQYGEMSATGEHSYTITTKDATCTEAGEILKTCQSCGKVTSTPIKAKGHNYISETTPATCTSNAIETTKCDRCGLTTVNELPDTMISHKFDGAVETNNDGTHKVYCSYDCGNSDVVDCTYSYKAIILPTYEKDGLGEYKCDYCGYSYTEVIPAVICDHKNIIVVNDKEATCTEGGYTGDTKCEDCGITIESGSAIPAKGHTSPTNYVVKPDAEEAKHLYYICSQCNEEIETDTFCLDITDVTSENLAPYAGIAELSPSGHKITLTATKYIDNFELSGTANDITISVDAFDDAEVKLCGVTIINSDALIIDDCIRINDKCTETEPVLDANGNPTCDTEGNPITEKVVPTVSISAKDGTVNTLKVTATGGNAIQAETKLEFKGHGTLNMETVSTSVDARSKLYIRNLTMNIKSSTNRGIDTKIETKNAAGTVISTDFANISFGANANVTINSADDGIRCKNMVFEAMDTALSDTDTIVSITSGGDAIQLEGKKGLTMNQGYMTLNGTKSAVNEKSGLNTYQSYVASGRITIV